MNKHIEKRIEHLVKHWNYTREKALFETQCRAAEIDSFIEKDTGFLVFSVNGKPTLINFEQNENSYTTGHWELDSEMADYAIDKGIVILDWRESQLEESSIFSYILRNPTVTARPEDNDRYSQYYKNILPRIAQETGAGVYNLAMPVN